MRFLILLILVSIPLFECYRFVREASHPYRYRVARGIENEGENYRVARAIDGSKTYRVARSSDSSAYRYRVHRGADPPPPLEEIVEDSDSVELSD